MTDADTRDAPVRRDHAERLKNKAARRKVRVRNAQPTRVESPAAPQHDVEIKHSRAPATTTTAAEFPLETFKARKHQRRFEIAFHQRHGIGEIPAGAAVCRVEDNRRCIEQSKLLVEAGDRRLHHARRAAISAVRAV